MIQHPILPVYDENSRILILGSFPSVRSREEMFFYGHPKNRFWKVIAALFGDIEPQCIEEKRRLLLKHNIAVWDVIASCDIIGSSDSSIKNVVPNDLRLILNHANIERIFVNGKAAEKYYDRYIKEQINREAVYLPSTSPANASWSTDALIESWKMILY